jgi:hypothetical protein
MKKPNMILSLMDVRLRCFTMPRRALKMKVAGSPETSVVTIKLRRCSPEDYTHNTRYSGSLRRIFRICHL